MAAAEPAIGHNTIAGKELLAFIERIERIETDRKALADDVKAVVAEAKARGYDTRAIRTCIKVRKLKPADRQEAEAVRDTYLHAIGMAPEPPLFRAMGLISADTASREAVIEALKKLVPEKGEIIVKAGGKPVRLWRDRDGTVRSEDHVEAPPALRQGLARRGRQQRHGRLSMLPGAMRRTRSRAGIEAFGQLMLPEEASEPILARGTRGALMEWLTEIWAKDALAEVGLAPRAKTLFHGPPGVGKTTMAHHLAARLGLAMLVVRNDQVQCRYVSATAEHVGQLFDAVADHVAEGGAPVVLFFDEFEALAQARMHGGHNKVSEHDHNITVNTLLARLEAHDGIVIAATNHADALDPAVWRRFDLHIEIAMPGPDEIARILERYFAPFVLPQASLAALTEACATATPALLRQLAEGIKRQIVIGPLAGWDMGREPTLGRVLVSVAPHPSLGKPRLWSHGAKDKAVAALPWPLARSLADYPAAPSGSGPAAGSRPDRVVPLGRRQA